MAADYDNSRVLMYGLPTRYFSVYSTPADDGWVRQWAQASHVGGARSAAGTLRVGDDALNRQYRSILSFDTSGLPDNATIRSSILLILQAADGTNPFTSFGPLMADIRRGSFGTPALQNSDFQAPASTIDFGHFTSIPRTLLPGPFPGTRSTCRRLISAMSTCSGSRKFVCASTWPAITTTSRITIRSMPVMPPASESARF